MWIFFDFTPPVRQAHRIAPARPLPSERASYKIKLRRHSRGTSIPVQGNKSVNLYLYIKSEVVVCELTGSES